MLLFSFNKTPIPESRWIPWESIPGVSRNVSHYSHCAAHCSVRGKWCNSFALDQGNCTLSRVGRESGETGGGNDIDVYVAESDSRGECTVVMRRNAMYSTVLIIQSFFRKSSSLPGARS